MVAFPAAPLLADGAAAHGEFGPAFAGADDVVLTDIYAAGEEPIAGVTVEALAEPWPAQRVGPVRVVPAHRPFAAELAAIASPNDAVLALGAGSIGPVPDRLVRRFAAGGAA